jgi:cytoskeletal protein CcmA (bactofilin family)
MWRKSSESEAATSSTPAPAPAKPPETHQAASKQAPAAPVATTSAAPGTAAAANSASPKSAPAASVREPVASGSASTISSGLKIKGEVTGTSDLTIDGEAQGKVRLTNGRVTVGEGGHVNADIEAREIVINGTVEGSLKASESVRLGPASRVEGSVLTPRIGIDDGAKFRGNVEMIRAGETPGSANSEPQKTQAMRATSASAED